MSIFDRRPKDLKPHSHRAPGRFTRVPLPAGMPGPDTAMYVEMDEPEASEPEASMTLVAAPPADPDATMHLPVVEDEREVTLAAVEETPAVRPLPARTPFATLTRFPPALFPSEPLTPRDLADLQRVADALRALPSAPAAYLFNITPGDTPNPYEALTGIPAFAGTRRLADGTLVTGLFLGDEDGDGRFGVDALDTSYLLHLRDAIEDALWAREQAERETAEGSAAA